MACCLAGERPHPPCIVDSQLRCLRPVWGLRCGVQVLPRLAYLLSHPHAPAAAPHLLELLLWLVRGGPDCAQVPAPTWLLARLQVDASGPDVGHV